MEAVCSFVVCIRCLTYNHAPYILDAMNGFAMQKTDFPFIAVIVDDASTDNTPQLVSSYINNHFDTDNSSFLEEREFGKILFARHRENKNCFFAAVFLKENHYKLNISKSSYFSRWSDSARFSALCEGDDYWTDPYKLQTQVNFMEAHGEYSLCCHRYMIYDQSRGSWKEDYVHALFDRQPDGFSFTRSDNLKTWITKTMTLMYRREWITDKELQKYKYRCDEILNYHLLSRGPGYCLPFVGAVYRRTDSGVFAPLTEKAKRMRGVLIRSELLAHNLEDNDLREDVYLRIKKSLFKDHSLKGLISPIGICLKSYYLTGGFILCLRIAKKFLGSLLKGNSQKLRTWFF